MPLVTEVGLETGHIVFDKDLVPSPNKRWHSPPYFSVHACCGQTAGWIKMPLGTMVGVGQGHIVLDGDPAHPKGAQHPLCVK